MQKRANCFLYCRLLPLIFIYSGLKAQTIENSINIYGANYPKEKIHMHFDKERYLPGETIWFKAYVFEENLPSERSTNFYAAIYDEKGKLIEKRVCPIFGSTTDGYFIIPDSVRAEQVICRAYTTWMLNFDTSFLFTRSIKLINSNATGKTRSAKTVSLQFFPEGGDVLEGTKNTIAFKSNYDNGLPFEIDGVIKKQETGEVFMPLKTVHDGMGRFDIDMEPGQKFYAEWMDNNGDKQQTWLPATKARGVSLKLTVQKKNLYYNLVNKTGTDSLHVLMYMYQKVFYTANIAVPASESFTGMVPVNKLPSGTMQLTVFDASWQPVAERVAFINNNNFNIDAAVTVKETNIIKRAKNQLVIVVPDTIKTNMSLSISDADLNNEATGNTIISDFLLKGDLKGYVHDPSYYFTNNNDADLRTNLDLVMLTNGWRRYNWAEMMTQKTQVIYHQPDEFLSVYGQVGKEALEKAEKDERVNLLIKRADSTNVFYSVQPDKTGLLKQTGLVFFDTAKVYFSFNKNKSMNKQMAFSTYNFTHTQPVAINNYPDHLSPDTIGANFNSNTSLFKYYSANNGIAVFNNEKTLDAVTVKTTNRRNWKNDPLVKLDERYASGMFSGGATGYSVDVLHDEKAWTKLDVYTYLRSAIPVLRIGNFNLTSGRSLSYLERNVLIYIDEHEMTTSDLESLSLSDVAYIKLIPSFLGRGPDPGGSGINAVLSVYTKKGDDMIDRRPKETDLGMVKVAGYSPTREFYSPDYTLNNTTTGTDARTTLLWLPYILTDASNHTVPVTFYNNDFTKKFRLVLEGISEEGKMIHMEKIIE